MGNVKLIIKIYNNLNELTDSIAEFPETSKARKRFKKYVMENFFLDVTLANERQGFIWGFQYAIELLMKGGA